MGFLDNRMLRVVLAAVLAVIASLVALLTFGGRPVGDPGTERVLAPVEAADLIVRESAPPQYSLRIRAGLPNGCARQGGYEIARAGADISVTVYNNMPKGEIACTQVYGTYEFTVDLGAIAGPPPRVTVNGRAAPFGSR